MHLTQPRLLLCFFYRGAHSLLSILPFFLFHPPFCLSLFLSSPPDPLLTDACTHMVLQKWSECTNYVYLILLNASQSADITACTAGKSSEPGKHHFFLTQELVVLVTVCWPLVRSEAQKVDSCWLGLTNVLGLMACVVCVVLSLKLS